MVATMLRASAINCCAVNATRRGVPVVADVVFRCATPGGTGTVRAGLAWPRFQRTNNLAGAPCLQGIENEGCGMSLRIGDQSRF